VCVCVCVKLNIIPSADEYLSVFFSNADIDDDLSHYYEFSS